MFKFHKWIVAACAVIAAVALFSLFRRRFGAEARERRRRRRSYGRVVSRASHPTVKLAVDTGEKKKS